MRDKCCAHSLAAAARQRRPLVATDVLGELIDGMAQLQEQAQLSMAGVVASSQELRNLGAVDVAEIAADEWERLTAWCSLLPFEQRRLLRAVR